LEIAKKAVTRTPWDWMIWNTLGIAQYRCSNWMEAVGDLEKSMRAMGDNAYNWLFLAMAYQKLSRPKQAREWYDKSVEWMVKHKSKDDELRRFRAEAEEVLGINKLKKQ